MNPQLIPAIIGLLQLGGLAIVWRMQLDQARMLDALKEWIHREYMPRELADERYVRRPEISAFSAVSQQNRPKT
jgi:hypothetical protein